MGSGIAAQIANADLPVLLLDLPAKTAGQPHAAAAAIDRLLDLIRRSLCIKSGRS